ncbi:MFS transporter [Microbacter sp. GSS18]|nr:MFS transporter [Microbacter sp. GSS18]
MAASPQLERTGARGVAVVSGLVLATLGATLPQSMTAPVISLTADAFDTTAAEASWALTVVLVIAVATTPVIGRLGDRFGARRVLLMLLPIVGLGLVIAAFSPTIGWLIAGRVLQGLGGGVFPLAVAIVPHVVAERRRAAVVGLLTTMLATAIGFGVLVSGLLVDSIGIRALSWVPFALVAAGGVIVAAALPHIPRRSGVHIDVPAALALSVGVVAILIALTEAPRWPIAPLWIALCAAATVASAVFWVRRERRSPDPLVGAHALGRPAVWTSHVTAALFGGALLGVFVLVPVFAEAPWWHEGLSVTVTAAGLLLLPATLAMLAVGPLAGVVRRWLGTRAPVVIGAVIATAGALVLVLTARGMAAVVAGTILLGAGIAIGTAGLSNVLVDVADDEHVASAIAFNVVARQLGGAVGAASVAAVLSADNRAPDAEAFGAAFLLIAVLTGLAVVSSLMIPSTRVARRRP